MSLMQVQQPFFILGGYRPFLIEDITGKVIWEEFSQKPESMRPYFLIPGAETKDLMEKICSKMDKEAENLQTFDIELGTATIKINVTYHLAIDGKLIEMSSGLSKFTL